jgi:N-acetylmuramoyl-L-alanine amidase
MKVIIDPGHGGKDPGGGSNNLWLEKDKTLEISLYQLKRLKELGIDVEITRDKDIYLGPTERTKIVRDSNADICISNHINAGGGEGAETIHSIFSDGKLATIILDKIVAAGQKKRRVFCKKSSRWPGKDYYYMHRQTGNVETVIVEYGFADNENDTKRIKKHWKEYAEAVIRAICQYADIPYSNQAKEDKADGPSPWAKEAWEKSIRIGLNDGAGAKNPVTEEQLMVFFDRLGLLDR